MDKESLLKAREFLLNINNIDMSAQDKLEIINNLWLYLDPENYEKHTKILIKECNEELKWKRKI
jgi:hypothetical protein